MSSNSMLLPLLLGNRLCVVHILDVVKKLRFGRKPLSAIHTFELLSVSIHSVKSELLQKFSLQFAPLQLSLPLQLQPFLLVSALLCQLSG
jgi:hypothetical protein